MLYLKSALIGLAATIVGSVATLLIMLWVLTAKARGQPESSGGFTVGFSPVDAAHSIGFWAVLAGLFLAGSPTSMVVLKKRSSH